ncbi:membrane protein YoeI [Klebsiella pneumoniae]
MGQFFAYALAFTVKRG